MEEKKVLFDPKNTPKRGEFCAEVVDQEKFGPCHKAMTVKLIGQAAHTFAGAKAGQFVQIACRELDGYQAPTPLLRRPISIAGVSDLYRAGGGAGEGNDHSGGTEEVGDYLYFEIIYRILGPGTQWLSRREVGATIHLRGPLGNGFTMPEDKGSRILLVGGGIGLPPMFFLGRQLAQYDYTNVVGFAAARNRELLPCQIATEQYQADEPLKPQMVVTPFTHGQTPSIIVTNDGDCGFRGHAVEAVEQFLRANPLWQDGQIFACGPEIMLKTIAQLAQRYKLPCQVCMEAYMACGMGVCQSCIVPTRSAQAGNDRPVYKLACTHGPVFDGSTVIWE